jgi:hypothetical protein
MNAADILKYGHKREHSAQIAAFRDRLERL